MANEREFINSFQGKNVDSDELQNLDNNSFFDIVSRYNVSDDGVLTSKVKPRYNNSFNNPAPEDPSRFDPPPPDPIRITRPDALDVPASTLEYSTLPQSEIDKLQRIVINPGREYETSSRYGDRGRFEQFDAPEENIDSADIDEATFDLANYSSKNSGGVLGPPIGLNESAKLKKTINQSKNAKSISGGAFMEDLSKIAIDTRPNELNQFASYTYNIALYMLNSKSYVDITKSPRTPQDVLDPQSGVSKLLMRSGGTGLDATEFDNDFFIDDLEVTNIAAGPNKFKQNTNAVNIRFTITEPRGVTLLERLQNAAASVLVSTRERYIHAPYLLEITFKGYDEQGRPIPAPSFPKYIPIRITDMQFEVNATGTQYKVEAIPFAQFAMGSIVSIIPFNIELSAVTVGDIFNKGVKIEVVEERVIQDYESGDLVDVIVKDKKLINLTNLGEVLTENQKKRTESTLVLSEKFNEKTDSQEIQGNLIPAAAEGYDTYEFVIAKEIANAKLNLPQLYDALNTPTPTEKSSKEDSKDKSDRAQFNAYVQSLGQGVTLSKNLSTFKVNAGTDVTRLLNLLILHSDYMDQNIIDQPREGYTEGDPIKWFKVRPVIKSADGDGKGFDEKDGRYKYFIDFVVEKSTIHYSDFPWAKKSKPTGDGVHKKYDYIFQGNNTEVLNFDLKFRAAFIQVMTAGTGSPFANKKNNATFAPLTKEIVQSAEGNTINSKDSLKRARAKDLFSTVMSDGVDMVELDLQIIGDPAYLPTSDAYWQDKVRAGNTYTTSFMPDGTINYNISPPYIQMNLKTPTDYDESSGLANPNRYGNSSFSGVYQVSQVESTFSGGQFQQRIYGFRAPMQPTEVGVARDTQSQQDLQRDAVARDNEFDDKEPQAQNRGKNKGLTNNVARVVTPIQTGGYYGEFGGLDNQDPPYTSPQVNNERTTQIAQQADQSVFTIDAPDDVSATEAWISRYTPEEL